MKLDVKDPQVFNKWREQYDTLTNEEHLQFIEDCAIEWPGQKHFTPHLFDKAFDQFKGAHSVMEFGGWKGELAQYILNRHTALSSWDNYDVCRRAIFESVETPIDKYFAYYQREFDWFKHKRKAGYDIFVSSNAIEHLSNKHLIQLLDHIDGIQDLIIEAPLLETIVHEPGKGRNWENYWGTHICEFTWPEIITMLDKRGYSCNEISPIMYHFVARHE